MKIKIPVEEGTYFKKVLLLLKSIPPFDQLMPRQLELYAYLLEYNYLNRNARFEDRNKLIFNADVRHEIAEKMGIKLSGVYNLMRGLREVGIINKNSLKVQYLIPKSKVIILEFLEDE